MQPWQDRKCTILQLQTAVKRYLQPGKQRQRYTVRFWKLWRNQIRKSMRPVKKDIINWQ
jgi:hypothetical protein